MFKIDMKNRTSAFVSYKTTFSHEIRWLNGAYSFITFPFPISKRSLTFVRHSKILFMKANSGTTEAFMKICDMNDTKCHRTKWKNVENC